MLSRTNGMISLHQKDLARFSIKPHPPARVVCLVPPFAAVTQVPHSTTGCTIKRADMKHCGRHRLPMSLTQRGGVAWEPKACFFIKCCSSISRHCSWIRHFHVYETKFLLNLTPKLLEFLQHAQFLSHPLQLQNFTIQEERLPKKPSCFLTICLREKVRWY